MDNVPYSKNRSYCNLFLQPLHQQVLILLFIVYIVLSFPQVINQEREQATYMACVSWTITAHSYMILRVLRMPDNAHSA